MSLLNRGTEVVTVFPEEVTTDADGNTRTRPSTVGVVARAVVQPMTSTEDASVGFETTSKYRLRLVGYPEVLGGTSSGGVERYAVLNRGRAEDLQRLSSYRTRRLRDDAVLDAVNGIRSRSAHPARNVV